MYAKLFQVASHFYSYSFALNPDWSRKYSMRPEIQAYFRSVAEQYKIVDHVRFHSIVEKAAWNDLDNVWEATILDLQTKERTMRRAKVLVSGVGSLSLPKTCDLPGVDTYQGKLFHSAQWDHSFDWTDKDVVVLGMSAYIIRSLLCSQASGNGCSATQFVPIMANEPNPVRKLTQFGRQAQYLAERQNPHYSNTFKAVMRYVPLAMRLYRAKFYYDMERDWSGFDIETGRNIRQNLAKENEAYVKSMAPPKYWGALIPKTEIGCKRKVLDTDYLKTLWRDNIELVANDPVERISDSGVVTKSGREVKADAIVLATGFATQQMLCPMEIVGREGLRLNDYVSSQSLTARNPHTNEYCSGTRPHKVLRKLISVLWSHSFRTSSFLWAQIPSPAISASYTPLNARSTLPSGFLSLSSNHSRHIDHDRLFLRCLRHHQQP
jgi:cation diffusion facilitator CzcD-associated flavoprotein CzcO